MGHCVYAILLIIWSCSIELVFVLRVRYYPYYSTSRAHVAMSYNLTVRKHRDIRWINWVITTTNALEDMPFSVYHLTEMPLWESWALEWLMLWREYTWLIDEWFLIEGIWIIMLTPRHVLRGDIIEDVKILILAWFGSWSICKSGVFLVTTAGPSSSSKTWIHDAFIHIRHVEFWLFKFILDLLGLADFIMNSRSVHPLCYSGLVRFTNVWFLWNLHVLHVC